VGSFAFSTFDSLPLTRPWLRSVAWICHLTFSQQILRGGRSWLFFSVGTWFCCTYGFCCGVLFLSTVSDGTCHGGERSPGKSWLIFRGSMITLGIAGLALHVVDS
jgi:CDP-diglyceride synthetase